jgi:hypothetical protein
MATEPIGFRFKRSGTMALEQNGKSLLKSRTFWKEAFVILGAVSTYMAGALEAKFAIGGIVSGVLGIAIRAFLTNTGITSVIKE